MAFDKNLDKELFGEYANFETTRLRVSIFSYNDGEPKLQISRENLRISDGGFTFTKLGRMSKAEINAIKPLIDKALEKM
jgi:hypothetical protein